MFVKDTMIEYANGLMAYVGDVIEDADVTYAVLMQDGKFAAAYAMPGEEDWCFAEDSTNPWYPNKWQAFKDIVACMRETAAL